MMQLNFEQLKSLFTGVASFEEENGYLKLYRYTKKQMDFYKNTSDRNYLRAGASADIILDFNTDSTNLSFNCKIIRASSLQMGYIDIYVDGKLKVHEGKMDNDENEIIIDFKMPIGTKRVTIYFPCLFSSQIKDFRIDKDAYIEKIQKERKFMFFGDSITQGYISEFPSLSYANLIGNKFDAEIMNQAIGGEFFDVTHLDDTLEFTPDVIFIAYGTNDWNSEKDITKNATEYFDKLTMLYPKAKIIDILPIWRTDIIVKNEIKKYTFDTARSYIKDVCAKYDNVIVLDGFDYVPHFQNFYFDHVHPNELGYAYYANTLENDLIKILGVTKNEL